MWKKSLLALLVVSPLAFSQVEKSKKSALVTFNESEVTEKITLAKSQWQHDADKTALLLQQQRESFLALEYLLNGAVKQQSLSASTISLAQGLIGHYLKPKLDSIKPLNLIFQRFFKNIPIRFINRV